MKIVFSRKGFDSKFGGVPSPIFPDGRICSLPIPDKSASVRYHDLRWDEDSLGTVVEDLTQRRLLREHGVHNDPDLRVDAMPRPTSWLPGFGQAKAAQGHLRNHFVGKGDVFLFFGWFRNVHRVRQTWSYTPNSANRHILFGWLQIEGAYDLSRRTPLPPAWTVGHPHRQTDYKNNFLYTAGPRLKDVSVLKKKLPGGGVFPRFHERLQLTAPNETRSVWRLPKWFFPRENKLPLSYHATESRWRSDNLFAYLNTVSIGQEFVLDCDHYPDAVGWLMELFNECT